MKRQTFTYQTILGASVTFVLLLYASTARPQATNQYDKGTPPQFAAGVSSFGSYTSADVGTVNLSNGALNLKIPLVNVGGRGMSFPITLNWSSKIWSASIDLDQERGCGRGGCDDPNPSMVPLAYADYANADNFVGFEWRAEAGWTVGGLPYMVQRVVRINYTNIQPRGPCYGFTLPKLVFSMPDRGEVEFRDDVYDGAPLPSDCSGWVTSFSRGHRWHATDGSGAVYITDVDNGASGRFPNLTGVVITSDGTRFYLNAGGGCHTIVDRNGNKITLTENGIVDQLGRTTRVQSNVSDPENPSETLAVLVTVTGYGGQPRYYKIRSGIMNQHYRSDINPNLPVITGSYDPMSWGYSDWWPTTATKLFPLSYGLFVQRIDDRPVIYELILPDGRSMRFNYNEFGEVAEVQMPTGGKVWYDYGSDRSFPAGNSPTWETTGEYHTTVWQVDRGVVQRRTFPDGTTLEGTWNYNYSGSSTLVTASAPDGTLVLNQAHFFLPAGRYTDDPFGGSVHTGTYYALWSTGVEWRTETRDAAGVVLAALEQDWTQRTPVSWSVYAQEQPANDNRVNEERRILEDGSVGKTRMFYQPNVKYNNTAEVQEFDFDQSLKRRVVTVYADSNNLINGVDYTSDLIHLLRLPLSESIYDGDTLVAQTVNEYDVYVDDTNHALLGTYASVTQHDTNFGGLYTTRGNVTRTGRWLNLTNRHIYDYQRYDELGNIVSTKDPNGNVTTVSFADNFGDGSNPSSGASGTFGPTYALPTMITSPPPTLGAAVHTARTQYDFSTGLLTGFKDRNNIIAQTIYNDPFNRPTVIKTALGITGVEAHTKMHYAPATAFGISLANDDVLTVQDQTNLDDAILRSWTRTDGFGRIVESWTRDPLGDIKVATIYDPLGRDSKKSNPFRPSLGETAVYTTTAFDFMGRVTSVTTPDTAVLTTSYSSNASTVTDQAGKKRRSVTDALGRLIRIDEPDQNNNLDVNGVPVQSTNYSYDLLDNLTGVSQGSQTRTFAYDSLRRLISSTNPEGGTIGYQYDGNGNLLVRFDARGVAAHHSYDALNRVSRRWYNSSSLITDTTHNNPALPGEVGVSDEVKYFYDSQTLPQGAPTFTRGASTGRLVAATYGSGSSTGSYHGYDVAGRSVLKIQQLGSVNYKMEATYDLAGSLITQKYPSDRTVTFSYDIAGRTNSVTGSLGDGTQRNYSTSISYSPFGWVSQERFGTATPIYNKLFYNVRGQLSEIREGLTPDNTNWERGAIINHYGNCWGMCQGQPMPDNNGNLKKQEHWIQDGNGNVTAIATQQFEYDELNRVKRVYEGTTWQEIYLYDRYGNRRVDVDNTSPSLSPRAFEVETNTNRLLAPGDLNLPANQRQIRFDAAGNVTNDSYTGQGQRTYDAEDRMTAARGVNGTWQFYTYDCDGRRVKRTVNGTETWQVYGFGGELLAEYPQNGGTTNPQKEYGYRNGQLLITATAGSAGWGTPPTFQNNPIEVAETTVRSVHITELRSAIDAVRSHFNLGPYPWQTAAAPGDWITTAPIQEMRTALDQALGAPVGGYAAGLASGQLILKVHIQELRDRILGVWQSGSGAVDIRWLVMDQLGTPRMVFDQGGSLANVSRHDYLPFGQELFAAGRTPERGYTNTDGTRQRFTGYERDSETELDFAQARYYASTQGRFTSVDPLESSARVRNPQTWNRYSYVLNNPLRLIDPEGLSDRDPYTQLQELVKQDKKKKKTPPKPAETKNPVSPKAPKTGTAEFRTPFFSGLNGVNETQAAYNLLVATYGKDAESVYDSWTEYDQAVFLNTVAAMQDAFGDKVSWAGIKFVGFYRHERNDLAYGIKVSGVTEKMLDKAGLGDSIYGRRSPDSIKIASLEATVEGSTVDFDIDLYNVKTAKTPLGALFGKHKKEVDYNREKGVTTHPADVTRALNARGVKSGVIVP